jgi:8-amino-7-oxononanoate synthase
MGQPLASHPAGSWLDRWLEACAELDRLQARNPMLDAVIKEINGRRIRVGDRWLHDFAS